MTSTRSPSKRAKRPTYVWAVLYSWDYEGSSLEAIYARQKDAKLHPPGGDSTDVRRVPIRYKPPKERA